MGISNTRRRQAVEHAETEIKDFRRIRNLDTRFVHIFRHFLQGRGDITGFTLADKIGVGRGIAFILPRKQLQHRTPNVLFIEATGNPDLGQLDFMGNPLSRIDFTGLFQLFQEAVMHSEIGAGSHFLAVKIRQQEFHEIFRLVGTQIQIDLKHQIPLMPNMVFNR